MKFTNTQLGILNFYNYSQPGLFCLCGRILQSIKENTSQDEFLLLEWRNYVSEGILIEEIQKYHTTNRIIKDFKKNNEIVKESCSIFKNLILYDDKIVLDPSKDAIKFLLNEGLIVPVELRKFFKITSPMIRDIFGILLIEKSKIPKKIISIYDFNIEEILVTAIQYFDFKKLINCYNYCTKKKETETNYTCDGLKEAVYQYELGAIFRGWFPNEINVCVQAQHWKLDNYADIFLHSGDLKIIFELLAGERYGPINRSSSVLGHIERTYDYGNNLKAIPWIINFVTLKDVKNFDKIKYPGENNEDNKNNVNIVYIFNDKNFDNIKMKFTKINEETKIIDIKIKE
jgi:hypothetical protein